MLSQLRAICMFVRVCDRTRVLLAFSHHCREEVRSDAQTRHFKDGTLVHLGDGGWCNSLKED